MGEKGTMKQTATLRYLLRTGVLVVTVVVIMILGAAAGDAGLIGSETTQATAAIPVVKITPAYQKVEPGDTFTVTVMMDSAVNLGAFEFAVSFDPSVLHVEGVELGDFLGSTERTTMAVGPEIDNEMGSLYFGAFSLGRQLGPEGTGALAVLDLMVESAGVSLLDLHEVRIADTQANLQTVTVEDGSVTAGYEVHLPLLFRSYLPLNQ